jgi:hypothetical protein
LGCPHILSYEQALESHDENALQLATEKMDACNGWEYETRVKQILSTFKINDLGKKIGEQLEVFLPNGKAISVKILAVANA